MSAGCKMTLATAQVVGGLIKRELEKADAVEKCEIVGSVRRGNPEVGDVEILYIPRFEERTPTGSIFPELVNLADIVFEKMLRSGLLSKRISKTGNEMWGDKNKLALYNGDLAVDLFSCTEKTWVCNFLCRTGGKETNKNIAIAARKKGLKWRSTGEGFEGSEGKLFFRPRFEYDIFDIVGLDYLEPEDRP